MENKIARITENYVNFQTKCNTHVAVTMTKCCTYYGEIRFRFSGCDIYYEIAIETGNCAWSSERIKTMVRIIIIENKTYDLLKSIYRDSLLYFLLHIPFFKRKINLQDDTIFIMRVIKWKPFGYLFYNKEIVYFPKTKLHFTLYLCSKNEYKEA